MDPQFAMVVCALRTHTPLLIGLARRFWRHWRRSSFGPLAGPAPRAGRFGQSPGSAKRHTTIETGSRRMNPRLPHLYKPPSTPSVTRAPSSKASESKVSSKNQRRNVLPCMARAVLRRSAKPVGPTGRHLLSSHQSGVSEISARSGKFRQPMSQKKRKSSAHASQHAAIETAIPPRPAPQPISKKQAATLQTQKARSDP